MADILGTVDSCIEISSKLWNYVQGVRHANENMKDTILMLNMMKDTLVRAQARLRSIPQEPPVPEPLILRVRSPKPSNATTNHPDGKGSQGKLEKYRDSVSRIDALLTKLLNKVEPGVGHRAKFKQLKYPLVDKDIQDDLGKIRDLIEGVKTLLHDEDQDYIRSTSENANRRRIRKDLAELTKWLCPYSFMMKKSEEGNDTFPSSKWLLESPEFRAWLLGRPWILWCYGGAGVGKTFMSAQIIDYLQRRSGLEKTICLSLFLDYKDTERQTYGRLIGCLAKQLVKAQGIDSFSPHFKDLYERSWGEHEPKPEELLSILEKEFKAYERVYIVVDGWDHAAEIVRKRLLDTLIERYVKNDSSGTAPKFSILVTARVSEAQTGQSTPKCAICNDLSINIYWECTACDSFRICETCKNDGRTCPGRESGHEPLQEPNDIVNIPFETTDQLLRDYVDWHLDRLQGSNRRRDEGLGRARIDVSDLARVIRKNPELKEKIADKISEPSFQTMHVAWLYMNTLRDCQNSAEVDRKLQESTNGMNELYEENVRMALEQRDGNKRKWAKRILAWSVFSKRPLSAKAMIHATAIKLGDIKFDERDSIDEMSMLNDTMGLVSIDNGVVSVQQTLDKYLNNTASQWFPDDKKTIALTLLTYLNFEELDKPCGSREKISSRLDKPCGSREKISSRLDKLPLLSYASQYWWEHVESYELDDQVHSLLLNFLFNDRKIASSLEIAEDVSERTGLDPGVRKGLNGLHIAAWRGFDAILNELVQEQGMPVDSKDTEYGQTALTFACHQGHFGTVERLLALGASPNTLSKRKSTPIYEAYKGNNPEHDEIAKMLASRSQTNLNLQYEQEFHRPILTLACLSDDKSMVKTILGRGDVDVNIQDQSGRTALIWAILKESREIIGQLLEIDDIQINLADYTGMAPIHAAVNCNNSDRIDIVEELLKHGADISLEDKTRTTAIQEAVDRGKLNIVKLLLDRGANLNSLDNRNRTLLHRAACTPSKNVLTLLIDRGLDPSAKSASGGTALHEACRYMGRYSVEEILLDRGVDRSIEDKHGRTPAIVAWQNGRTKSMKLMEGVANPTSLAPGEPFPKERELPLWSLVLKEKSMLLESLATSMNIKSSQIEPDLDNGNTALHYTLIAFNKRLDNISKAKKSNADSIEARAEALNSAINTIKLLLRPYIGLSLNATNDLHRTPLHLAALSLNKDLLTILLSHNPPLHLEIRDIKGFTPLHLVLQTVVCTAPLDFADQQSYYATAVQLLSAGAVLGDSGLGHVQRLFIAAVDHGQVRVAERMIGEGADMGLANEHGYRAGQIACRHKDKEMQEMLDRHRSFVEVGGYTEAANAAVEEEEEEEDEDEEEEEDD